MQDDPPSPYTGGPPQPKSRTQGESDHDSTPGSDQKTTGVQDNDIDISMTIRQILDRQKVGKFKFEREFGIIKNPVEFIRRLDEYEAMNNKPKSCTDFPPDPETQREFALKIGKAIVNMDRASDVTTNNNQRKAEQDQDKHDHGDKEPGGHDGSTAHSEPPEDKATYAVNHLNRLKTTEVEIMSWIIMFAALYAQRGELRRGTWGNDDIKQPERFNSWRERIETIIEVLDTSKSMCRGLFQKGQRHLEQLAAQPNATKKRDSKAKQSTAYQTAQIANLKKERRLAAPTQQDPPPSLTSPNAPTPGFADSPGQSSPAATSGPSAFTGPSPSASTPLQSSPRTPLPSSAPPRQQASGFPSSPSGASLQNDIPSSPGTRASVEKRPQLSSQPQEEYSPGTRSAGASSSPKRQKRHSTTGGSGFSA